MSAPPGAFESSGGAVNQQTQNGTGPPNKRPKMDDQNNAGQDQSQMGANPLDNIFGTDSGGGGGMGLSDDLIKNTQQQERLIKSFLVVVYSRMLNYETFRCKTSS